MARLQADVYVRLADNFPYKKRNTQMSVDIDLHVVPKPHVLQFPKRSVELVSVYQRAIHDSSSLGLAPSATTDEIETALRNLVIALNVETPDAVFVLSKQGSTDLQVTRDSEDAPAAVERHEAGSVHITATLRISASAGIQIGTKIEVNEPAALATLSRMGRVRDTWILQALDRFDEGTASLSHITAIQKCGMDMEKLGSLGHASELRGAALDAEVQVMSRCSRRGAPRSPWKTRSVGLAFYPSTSTTIRSPPSGWT